MFSAIKSGVEMKQATELWISNARQIVDTVKLGEVTEEVVISVIQLLEAQIHDFNPDSVADVASLRATLHAVRTLYKDSALAAVMAPILEELPTSF